MRNKIFIIITCMILFSVDAVARPFNDTSIVSLNGKWEMGFSRHYSNTVIVPGIATDPAHISDETLWYKKEIKLPPGNWKAATLELKGARFEPEVYINGQLVAKQQGGMGPIFFVINQDNVKPGKSITLEIALASLKTVPQTDASYIPQSDQWRSNVASGLWDDVVLHLHGSVSIERIVPFMDYKHQKVDVRFDLNSATDFHGIVKLQIVDGNGRVLISKVQAISGAHASIKFDIAGKMKSWSPDTPNLYHLKLIVSDAKEQFTDQSIIPFGVKNLEVINKQFYLNGQHFLARGATVVWHRWMRTSEGRELGYDTTWFKKNIVQRSKDLGANYLRFHLGLPPERFLDLCDRYGLAVQFEWSFFHGMPASKESLLEQYKSWLNVAARHPSVCFIHPYNETGGDQLKTAWAALDELLVQYPPLVLEDRDVIHIHKYWWSLFENLGLYYDSAAVFPKVIMVDEFGGNYLDENGDVGAYTSAKETYLRFLGRSHTKAERLAFHKESNVKVAEYWRRIGAAGFSPFCALASNEDGNSWFLGPLKKGNPKPVWDALAVAFSPQSLSLELWDRDFEPSQKLDLPVYVFNEENKQAALSVKVTVEDKAGKVFGNTIFTANVNAFDKKVEHVNINMPDLTGDYIIKAELLNKPQVVKHPVISEWECQVVRASVPANIKDLKIAIPGDEPELKQFLSDRHLKTVALEDASAHIILTSLKTWNKLATGDAKLSGLLQSAIEKGRSVVMLDVGDRYLGQGYPSKTGDLGPLQSVMRISDPKVNIYSLFGGISLKFTETAEPESHIHPDKSNRELWGNFPDRYTRIWNGMRGGLIVPAADMEFSGLSAKAFISQWKARGAREDKIITGPYYAYELQGFYVFSDHLNDKELQQKLKAKVNTLVQDAPSLANSINPLTPVAVTDLSKGYHDAEKGMADNFIPLANCAKNLTQTPVALVDFGHGKGKLLVSQLLTSGRLAKGFGERGLYGIRYDEVAVQYVLNMITKAVNGSNQ